MFVVNTNRTYDYPVKVTLREGTEERAGEFTATFKVLPNSVGTAPENAHKRALDLVLVDVKGVEVPGPDGQPLTGDALLTALKDDPCTSAALLEAYRESISKKSQ